MLLALAAKLRARPFDLVIDLQGLLKSALWTALARSPRKLGFDGSREGSYLALTERLPKYDPDLHAVERYLKTAAYLGAPLAPPRFRLPPQLTGDLPPVLATASRPVVVLHPGARWPSKLWPPAAWAELAHWLTRRGAFVVITGSPADRRLTEALAAGSPGAVLNLAGRTSLGELTALLRAATLAVTADTGPMHLAVALGTPVVALFGPTAPWRTGPYGAGHEVVRLGLACSPCFKRRCPLSDQPPCLTQLSFQAVQESCEKILASRQPAYYNAT
jgi:heptosyltransferase-1